MSQGFYTWSRTANNNATFDASINWAEGMPPSAVNDSARAMMARTAEYRDDIAGAIVTTGTSTAYSILSYQGFDTLAHLDGQMIAFTPHATCGGTVTLNVDGLGVKPLRLAPGVELLAGTLVQGTPYTVVYNNSNGAFYLHGFFSNPYNVPLFGGMDFWDTITPNSTFIFPMGQAISRTMYATAFARWGTKFGAGDGSTTFNVPDKTGRVSAMMEATASRLTATYFGGNSTNLGAVGGLESHPLIMAEMPTHAHTLTDPGHTHTYTRGNISGASGTSGTVVGDLTYGAATGGSTTGITMANTGGGGAHKNVQPTIICNYIIRII